METQKQTTHPSRLHLAALALGKVRADRKAELQKHLAGCSTCSDYFSNTPRETFVSLFREAQARASEQSTPGIRDAGTLMGTPNPDGSEKSPSPGEQKSSPSDPETDSASEQMAESDIPQELRQQTKYRILRPLSEGSEGGMASLFVARHEMMGRLVAIKTIRAELVNRPDAIKRFDQEIKAAASLAHDNVARAYDADQFGSMRVLVLELVAGQDLSKFLASKGKLEVFEACGLVHQALRGLQHAHERGMVHRDLKPQNLMRTPEGVVKILDFGLAKIASEQHAGDLNLTGTGKTMGTPHYIAPEQARDAAKADIRADIYGLGCTLYCLLTGKPPFNGNTEVELYLAHLNERAKPLVNVRSDIPRELSDLVDRMLAKDPKNRPQTPVDAARALAPFVDNKKLYELTAASTSDSSLLCQKPAQPISLSTSEPDSKRSLSDELATDAFGVPSGDTPHLSRESIGSIDNSERLTATFGVRRWTQIPSVFGWVRVATAMISSLIFVAFIAKALVTRDFVGTLVISNVPADGQVTLDGTKVSVTRRGDKTTIDAVPKGRHTVRITLNGKDIWNKEITVDFAGEIMQLRYEHTLENNTEQGSSNVVSGRSPSKQYQPPKEARKIDLLKLIDVAKDQVVGEWTKRGEILKLSNVSRPVSRIEIPYSPPEEYDIRMEIVRFEGNNPCGVVCLAGGRQFLAFVGSSGNMLGINIYDGRDPLHNASGARRPMGWLVNGSRHEFAVKVRRSGVVLYLDGAEVSLAEGPYTRFGLHQIDRLNHQDRLGLTACEVFEFQKIDLFEITGEGKILRETPADQ